VSSRTATQTADHAQLSRAYYEHCQNCPCCRRGQTWCETGTAILAAIATTRADSDLPGYGEGA
jgi:hypothetical protein